MTNTTYESTTGFDLDPTDDSISPGDGQNSDAGWSVGGLANSPVVRASYGTISVIGIVGNLLVCFIFFRVPSLRTSTSYFLVHLSVVDLLSCIMVIPSHLFPDPPPMKGRFGDFVCRFYFSKYPMWTFILVSVGSLVLINLERFVAIVYPLRYKSLYTLRNTILMIAACWLYSLAHNSFFFAVYAFTDETGCQYVGFSSDTVRFVFGVYHYFIYYPGPLGFMIATNCKMVRKLKQQISKLNQQKGRAGMAGQRELWQAQAAHELQKTLLFVVITFGILWGPNQTMFFCFLMTAPLDFTQAYYHAGVIIGVCNSCVNPLIYTLKNKAFRDGLKGLAGCCRANRVEDLTEATATGSLALTPEAEGRTATDHE
ncbi:galanin receptor 2a-like [Patiria miniata]|uniref:G-protein coupled receptors family 1 profile domain-containing protein n=1 Tax=Patiria miniata TaxID=46514 RepID=A0A913ZT68_PATMI|nr:galanin receptor 2a-like [Patiria miniata]